MNRSMVMFLVVVVVFAGACAGCNKFTRTRYETIHTGMRADEVRAILGKPKVEFSDSWSYVHDEPYYKAVLQFKDGRVAKKAWYDEHEMGDHPDSKFHRKGVPGAATEKRVTTP